MEEDYSEDEITTMFQFYYICKKVIHDTRVNYLKKLSREEPRVIVSTELTMKKLNQLATIDEYETDMEIFHVLDFHIGVKDDMLCKALERLTEDKRDVILLAYHMDMSDKEIAKKMNKARGTVSYHRASSILKLKEIMEELASESPDNA